MNAFRISSAVLAAALMPALAAAGTVPSFYDGMELTLRQGQGSSFAFQMDPCLGVASNCHARSYYGDQWVVQDSGMYWDSVGGSGVGAECDAGMLCLFMTFLPQDTGRFTLIFDTSYERRFFLGGDDTGPPFVVTDIAYSGHYLTVDVLPAAVPLPATGLLFGAALVGVGLLRRRRAEP